MVTITNKNTIPTIPDININIIIYQRTDVLADRSIDSKVAMIESKEHTRRTGHMNW